MKEINAYLVPRFSPEQCPKCLNSFKESSDFQPVAVQVKAELVEVVHPQLVGVEQSVAWNGENLIQFVECLHCHNITMIVNLDQRYVLTLQEAEESINQGFTAIMPVTIKQVDSGMGEQLSFWFQITYDRLHNQALLLRDSVSSLEDNTEKANRFEKGMNPIMSDIIREIKKDQKLDKLYCVARNALKNDWEKISLDSQELLIIANLIRDDLLIYSQIKPDVDFVAPVLFYAKAIENELYTKVFKPFAEVSNSFNYEYEVNSPLLKESIRSLKQLCEKGRKPNLGEMANCLNTLSSPRVLGNWFRTFIRTHIRDYEYLFVEQVFPQRMVGFINAYRNRWGIIGPLTRRECERCEEYLFYNPVKLLHLLADVI